MNTTPVPKLLAVPHMALLAGGAGEKPATAGSEPTTHYTVETIRVRAETVTRLLMEIPDYRPPPRWGINE